MATVTSGNPVTLDALFSASGQPSPDAVTFTVQAPDGTEVEYVSGVDAEVTNPSGDYWECAIGVPSDVGDYLWKAVGTVGSAAEVTETIYGTVFVIPSAVDPEASDPPGPMLGPCSTWITGEDVAACARFDYGSSPAVFDTVAWEASMALYEISGRIFPGLCNSGSRRPCPGSCGCWSGPPSSSGFGPYSWGMYGGGWGWASDRGHRFGCAPMSVVDLAGYPVREIVTVTIGGDDLPEFHADGYRQWRLDQWQYLVRMDTPGVGGGPATTNFWPGCQNLSLDADQPGTFEIVYKWGTTPPQLGRDAAAELALQLYLACGGGGNCVLPAGVTKVVRQDVTIERSLLANWLDPRKPTGLLGLDTFLQAYAGGQRGGRRSMVWSPDVQPRPRRVGTT